MFENELKDFLGKDQKVEDALLERIEAISERAAFEKNTIILNLDRKQDYLYLIIEGLARSYYIDEKGRDITKLFVREGEILIGEALFMDRSLEVFEAVEDVVALKIRAKEFKKIIVEDNRMKDLYIEILEETIRYKMKREFSFQSMDAKERYLEFLKTDPDLEKRLPQYLVASYLGIRSESLSRIKGQIKQN